MIFYFSATGNSKYAARRLLDATGGELVSVPECRKIGRFTFSVSQSEAVGIIFPTFFWGLPTLVEEFLQKLELTATPGTYLYSVATCGVTPGASGAMVEKLLRAKGLSLSARFSVTMPDTWTPIFDLRDKDKVASKNRAAEIQIDEIIPRVQLRERGDFMRGTAPYWFYRTVLRLVYNGARKTTHFTVSPDCIGCGLCANKCPVQAVEMQSGRPVWPTEQCALCLGCLHRCPKFAIQYGAHTRSHGQYQHPHETV